MTTPYAYHVRQYDKHTGKLVKSYFSETPIEECIMANLRHHFRVEVTVLVDAIVSPTTEKAGSLPPPSGDPSRTVDRIPVCYPWGDLTAELVRDGAGRNWIMYKGGSNIRHLNKYENNFVNSAIAASTTAIQAHPASQVAVVREGAPT